MVFVGYDGQIWSIVYNSFQYFIRKLEATSNPGSLVPLAESVYSTTLSGLEALNINRILQAWSAEYSLLLEVEALPITVGAGQALIFLNRVLALASAIQGLNSILPSASSTPVGPILDQGQSPIPSPDFLGWLNAFSYETPPVGLTSNNFISQSQTVPDAFNAVATLILALQGPALSSIYDTTLRFANTAQVTTNLLLDFTSGPLIPQSFTTAWNQLVTSTAFLLDAGLLTSSPYTVQAQQNMVLRFLILNIQNQLALFMLIMRQPSTTQINQALLMIGDSLMDVAARNTGNFENWASIATANGLLPPYIGAASSPGVAGWGTQVILPNPGTSTSAVGAVPSYDINFLGVDEYTGPINGSMPTWTGDYQYISGLTNLRWALGRRMQTTLGSLIYHGNYGCRIPPEVGNIQTASTVGHIAAFGASALQQDPRIASVISAIAQSLPNFAVSFKGVVKPGGFGTTALEVNEVISPTTAPPADNA